MGMGIMGMKGNGNKTRNLAVAKIPCACCVDNFWLNITGRHILRTYKVYL